MRISSERVKEEDSEGGEVLAMEEVLVRQGGCSARAEEGKKAHRAVDCVGGARGNSGGVHGGGRWLARAPMVVVE